MTYREQLANQTVTLDFADEVPYAFGWLPINAKLNGEIYARAIERARRANGESAQSGEPK